MELCKCLLVWMMVMFSVTSNGEANLRPNFYRSTCPDVESIVRDSVAKKVKQTVLPYRRPCGSSSMIASSRRADAEMSLAGDGFDTVIKAKQAVEAKCPGVVSCADILAIAARDVVVLSGGPNFAVELGRRDGLISQAWRVAGNLPGPEFDVNKLASLFQKNKLSMRDMIALSGAHTVGFSHCSRFADRFYNHSADSLVDRSFNPGYAKLLMQACPRGVDPTIAVNMDPFTPLTFDNVYYKNLLNGEGLFTSDEVLYTDERSRPLVKWFAANQTSFFRAFTVAMIRLGRVRVKTGNEGEIRKDCTAFN